MITHHIVKAIMHTREMQMPTDAVPDACELQVIKTTKQMNEICLL